ncbi:MarR family winged helix-turn-helix transcriptional regulator [Streptomyces sp. NBC_00083]|uniref:MarR family winged helix-turn-helix transcriptional regulator n=1 Tax=Streptomyces sp. NBC_00083 TaxID=2975647 RepID=UPI0022526A6B|nr:MarR family transcriptional regulator [Streptomyces sp. NBC_00083]MCX5387069.1 MarR family transcriptional regulator [Streptomyces sp. NBC_00083]
MDHVIPPTDKAQDARGAGGTDDPGEVAATLRLAVGRIARKLRRTHAVGDTTLSEVSVLARLERDGPDSPGALAELERVRPQAMATTLAALEQRGLVNREPDPSDRRRVVMTVTEAGRTVILDRRSESVRGLAHAIEDELTPAERRQLVDALSLLERLAERL